MVTIQRKTLHDLRHQLGQATNDQRFVSSVDFARSKTDPEAFAESMAALHDRWRHYDLPRMEEAADRAMREYLRTEMPEQRGAWEDAERDIYDCRIAIGDVDSCGHQFAATVRQQMRDRARRAGIRRIPKPRRVDTGKPRR